MICAASIRFIFLNTDCALIQSAGLAGWIGELVAASLAALTWINDKDGETEHARVEMSFEGVEYRVKVTPLRRPARHLTSLAQSRD